MSCLPLSMSLPCQSCVLSSLVMSLSCQSCVLSSLVMSLLCQSLCLIFPCGEIVMSVLYLVIPCHEHVMSVLYLIWYCHELIMSACHIQYCVCSYHVLCHILFMSHCATAPNDPDHVSHIYPDHTPNLTSVHLDASTITHQCDPHGYVWGSC